MAPSLKKMAKEPVKKRSKASKSARPKNLTPSQATFKSTEYIEESDPGRQETSDEDASSSDNSSPKIPHETLSKLNGRARAPSLSGSSSRSKDESESEESSSEGEMQEPAQDAPKLLKRARNPPTESLTKIVVATERAASYKPPSGFQAGEIDEDPRASQVLHKSNLKGKQLWYFTAPASVPVAEITHMSLKDAREGNAVFEHDGSSYAFVQDTADDFKWSKVLLPNGSGDCYQSASKSIEQVLHLQQVFESTGIYNLSTNGKATVPAAKPVRPQPDGLKMRFRPLGFGNGDTGGIGSNEDSDMEMAEAPPTLRKPSSIEGLTSEAVESTARNMAGVTPTLSKKTKPEKLSREKSEDSSKKRKRKDGEERKSKHKKSDRIANKV